VTSGGFAGALASLRRKHYINGAGGGMEITLEGKNAIGPVTIMPISGPELVMFWVGKLRSKTEKVIFEVIAANPNGIDKHDLCRITNYSPTSGGLAGALANLRGLKLVTGPASCLRPAEELR
jgi:hypothetical protein